jgi:hypothetical protein
MHHRKSALSVAPPKDIAMKSRAVIKPIRPARRLRSSSRKTRK